MATCKGTLVVENFVQSHSSPADIGILIWTATEGDESNLIDFDSAQPLGLSSQTGSIAIDFDAFVPASLIALINHTLHGATITVTVFELVGGGGASEVVLALVPIVADDESPTNNYFSFDVTNATILANGGPKSIVVTFAGAATPCQIGQLIIGNRYLSPGDTEGFDVNYSNGLGQNLVVNESAAMTIGGTRHGFVISQIWAFDGVVFDDVPTEVWQQLRNLLVGPGSTLPMLWIPALDRTPCFYVYDSSPGIPARIAIVPGVYSVGPFTFLEQPQGIS